MGHSGITNERQQTRVVCCLFFGIVNQEDFILRTAAAGIHAVFSPVAELVVTQGGE
ncbi:hypothetical protein [Shouchella hunanensis]|uniref:Uncharacterized protein n=1 Tax=Shouchella hunanensis TaxID=766894 RepID=A0ABY7W7G6_9BACI|nr:hypothetical protein [Shouchella hunanensis]WDF04883.1 hypothetical protein PQ477_05320 [Shouchella hunanensis]